MDLIDRQMWIAQLVPYFNIKQTNFHLFYINNIILLTWCKCYVKTLSILANASHTNEFFDILVVLWRNCSIQLFSLCKKYRIRNPIGMFQRWTNGKNLNKCCREATLFVWTNILIRYDPKIFNFMLNNKRYNL